MWSKFSNALKTRPDNDQSQQSVIPTSNNLRIQDPPLPDTSSYTEFPIPQPSPPSSPSKNGRLGLFKRGTKHSKPDTPDGITPLKLPLHLPKKVKSSLHLNTSDLPRSSTESNMLSPESALPPLTPLFENSRSTGSVRSILRDRKTPGTGQSVRFFSRDAYKVITPDPSVTTNSEPSDPPLLQRLQQIGVDASMTNANIEDTRYHSAFASPGAVPIPRGKATQQDTVSASAPTVESPIALPLLLPSSSLPASLLVTIPPPNLSNLFDVSQEYEIKAIPMNEEGRLRDDAVEVTDFDETVEGESQPPDTARIMEPLNANTVRGPSLTLETKSLGRRAGETIAQSFSTKAIPTRSSSSLGLYKMFGNGPAEDQPPSSIPSSSSSSSNHSSSSSNIRNRALSDTVFHRPTFSQESIPKIPEQDINDTSASSIVVYGNANLEPPDPFRANATTYYTPETRISNSPPRSHHTKSDSSATSSGYSFTTPSMSSRASEDAVMELRTQLALQQELSLQYEIDLNARDSLVENLTARLEANEKEEIKRRSVMKSWKKKVCELERAYRSLEEEVEKSRMESFERSIMDEASGEALRMLHRQIEKLERERGEVEKREEGLLGERTRLNAVIMEKEEIIEAMRRDGGVGGVGVGGSESEEVEKLKDILENAEQKVVDMQNKLDSCNGDLETIRNEKMEVESEVGILKERYENSVKEVEVLKGELEVQWRNAEAATDRIKALENEKAEWRRDLESWEARVTEMELEWTDVENRRVEMEAELGEVWEARKELESQRDGLINDLKTEKDLVAQLKIDLEQKLNQLSVLREESKFNSDNVNRLEAGVRVRDGEISEYSEKMMEQRQQIEELESELSLYKKDQDRVIEEQRRKVKEALGREADSIARLEAAVKEKAALEILAKTLKDHEGSLSEENEKLKRKVHDLVQVDADKDIKISNYKKMHEKDEDDKNQLNIALDSKQQELELLKRRLGVRGTAGSTPAPATRTTTTTNRRESFATPVPFRPGSALSDVGFGKDVGVTPTAAAIPALGKSSRVNAGLSNSTSGTASQPPPSAMKGRFVDGSMGPPVSTTGTTARPRSSLSGISSMSASVTTPAAARRMSTTATGLSRSTTASARPSIGTPSTLKAHRQASSVSLRSETSSVQDEKENVPVKSTSTNAVKAARRVSLKPTPIPS